MCSISRQPSSRSQLHRDEPSETHSALAQEGTGHICLITKAVTPSPFITRFASGEETDLANPLKDTVIRPSIEAPTEVKSVVSTLITPLSREQVRHSALLPVHRKINNQCPSLDALENVISDDTHGSRWLSELADSLSSDRKAPASTTESIRMEIPCIILTVRCYALVLYNRYYRPRTRL